MVEVALAIACDLIDPIRRIRFNSSGAIDTFSASVPKASMHKETDAA